MLVALLIFLAKLCENYGRFSKLCYFFYKSCFLKNTASKSKNTFRLISSRLVLLAISISFFMSVSQIYIYSVFAFFLAFFLFLHICMSVYKMADAIL